MNSIFFLMIVTAIFLLFIYSATLRRRREYFDVVREYVDVRDPNYPPVSQFSGSIVSARPTYATIVTPRFDSNVHAGVIRGSAPPLRFTAANVYPITPIYQRK